MNVYYKKNDGSLGNFNSLQTNHADAILDVCEELVASGEGYNKPVLAVIEGKFKEKE